MADYLPLKPVHDNDSPIVTFADAVYHVLDAFKIEAGSATKVTMRNARSAVLEAYRDIGKFHQWTWLRRRGFITTVAQESDGTVTYDHATRTVTRTGAANNFPTDVRFYGIEIAGSRYSIESRTSNTAIVLPPNSNPGADIASAASYILYRSQYPLPFDYRKGSRIVEENWTAHSPQFVSPNRLLRSDVQSISDYHGEYSIRGSNEFQGRRIIEFSPVYFTTERRYDFVYEARPREMRNFHAGPEYNAGAINIANGSTTVTAVAPAVFTSRMAGCILRLPYQDAINTAPTGQAGSPFADNPYREQRVIMSVDTGLNTLTLDVTPDEDYTAGTYANGVAYSISDPVDLELDTMLTVFEHLAEFKFARLQMLFKDQVAPRKALFESALRSAIEEDNVTSYYDAEERGPYYQFWNVSLQDDG